MATVSKDALLAAFVAFRDSLPANHDRRQVLGEVTDLRFDTKDPTICYLILKDQERPRRIDPAQPVEKVAEAMVLYPAHSTMSMQMPAKVVEKLASYRQPPIRDLFLTDTGKVVIHVEEGTDKEVVAEMLDDEILRQFDMAKYIATKLMRSIVRCSIKGTDQPHQTRVEISLDDNLVRMLMLLKWENGDRLQSVKTEVAAYLERFRVLDQSNGTQC